MGNRGTAFYLQTTRNKAAKLRRNEVLGQPDMYAGLLHAEKSCAIWKSIEVEAAAVELQLG